VIDAAHDERAIAEAVARRSTVAIIATNDHINAAPELAEALDAPIWNHPDDLMKWRDVHPTRMPDGLLADG